MYESKCLSCALFWKTQKDKNKRCYLGGSNGGMIDYCTGYVKSNAEQGEHGQLNVKK